MKPLLVGACALLLSSCATQPRPLQGNFTVLTPRDAIATDYTGSTVRWGGRVLQVESQTDRTCFEMVSARLDQQGRPMPGDESGARFIACRKGFYDPAVFKANREVTFAGKIGGYDTRRVGNSDFNFPRVEADSVYLWPERVAKRPRRTFASWWGY